MILACSNGARYFAAEGLMAGRHGPLPDLLEFNGGTERVNGGVQRVEINDLLAQLVR
jgi:hypothetical protein